jgi:hypothetical protein
LRSNERSKQASSAAGPGYTSTHPACLSEPSQTRRKYADGRDARLPRCVGIVGRVTDRDGVGAFELEILENDLENVRRRFGFF